MKQAADIVVVQNGLLTAILSGYTLSLLAPWLARLLRRLSGWLIALLPLGLFLYFARLTGMVAEGQVIVARYPWVPSLGVNLNFVVDGLGLFMALIISGIGTLVIIYASSYLAHHEHIGRFYAFILMFMASMLALVLADNIFVMFIAWELTSLASYFLIGFYHEREEARDAALQALLVTNAGGLAMMAGLILLSMAGGSSDFSTLRLAGDAVRSHSLYAPILALILLGAFTKSAQFPFHFWLPNAMAGPAPVSTYLHSATMVTAGVYLLARLTPTLGGTGYWFYTITLVGAITALLGAWRAWQQTDLKALLAYSTISALGTLMLLVGVGTEPALTTAVLFLLVHALYKAGLFMAAGTIDHETHSRNVDELGGLRRTLPYTFAATILAALSMAGIPPLLGFVSKELMYETTLHLGIAGWQWGLTVVLLLTNLLMVTAAAIVAVRPFFGPATAHQPQHRPSFKMWLGPLLLGSVALALGLLAAAPPFSANVIAPAVAAITGHAAEVELSLWHGLTPMVALSVVTLGGGIAFYRVHLRLRRRFTSRGTAVAPGAARLAPARVYDAALSGLMTVAKSVTSILQNGYLRYYLLFVVVTFMLLVGVTLLSRGAVSWADLELTRIRVHEGVIVAVILAAVLTVVRINTRLGAVATLGVVGYGIAVLYLLFSGPDLAMTQFAVETLAVVLFVLVLYRLPRFETFSKPSTRLRDAVIAILIGSLMGGLVLAAKTVIAPSAVTDFYAANSYVLAKGHNVVNVVLTDFRGFDTMVEVTVLSVAAIGVYALLKSRPQLREKPEKPTPETAGKE